MKLNIRSKSCLFFIVLSLVLGACSRDVASVDSNTVNKPTAAVMDVYKSPTCGCCGDWVDHIQEHQFSAKIHHPEDLNQIKNNFSIQPRYQSCHTAVSKEGYVFEGHVPADLISRYLAAPPADSIGLAVPGMPVGSPGMEMGDRHDDYDVLLLKKDGSSEVYEHVTAAR